MEARQSSPVCAHIGLLLLIGLGCSHLPEVQGKPIGFWCNAQHRTDMRKMTENLKEDMTNCSDTLPAPVQLPCGAIRAAEWANKTVQEKSAEVMGDLQVFQEGLQMARNHNASSECQIIAFKKLESRIKNYIIIVNSTIVNKQNGTSQAAVNCYSSENSFSKVLHQFGRLLKVKLEALVLDLSGSMCN